MRYTVVWERKALDELAELWLSSLHRGILTVAANAIDPALRDDPDQAGAWLDHETKALYIYPLRILFEINDDDRKVRVLRILLDLSAG